MGYNIFHMKINVLSDDIVYIEDVVTEHSLFLKGIESIENDSIPAWEKWNMPHLYCDHNIDHNSEGGLRKKIIYQNHNEYLDVLISLIEKPFLKCLNEYSKITGLEINLADVDKNYDIRKYSVGDLLHSHIDNYGENVAKDISVMMYLNDDYTGGEIYFKDIGLKIKPSAGSVLFFNGHKLWHESLKITDGNKIYIPFFVIEDTQKVISPGNRSVYN